MKKEVKNLKPTKEELTERVIKSLNVVACELEELNQTLRDLLRRLAK